MVHTYQMVHPKLKFQTYLLGTGALKSMNTIILLLNKHSEAIKEF
jgi:hypothetical protein